jgi:hypothetical protein
MSDQDNTPVEETVLERAKRKLADAESALFGTPPVSNKNQFDGAIGREI